MAKYTWRVGDVFTNGTNRWKVVNVSGDRAVLQSCTTAWAMTILLTIEEWQEHGRGRWTLEEA